MMRHHQPGHGLRQRRQTGERLVDSRIQTITLQPSYPALVVLSARLNAV